MKVSDFLLLVKDDLQEKKEQWSVESLLSKLKIEYSALQADLPYFIIQEEIEVVAGVSLYYLNNKFLKESSCFLDGKTLTYLSDEDFFKNTENNKYTVSENQILLSDVPSKNGTLKIVYKYDKKIKSLNCFIGIPQNWYKCLMYLLKASIYEKPVRNTKERDLNKHYLNLYEMSMQKLKKQKARDKKNIKPTYQII